MYSAKLEELRIIDGVKFRLYNITSTAGMPQKVVVKGSICVGM